MRENLRHHRVAEAAPVERRRGSPLRCAVPGCPAGTVGDECLCRDHWNELPWSMRNDAGTGWRPPASPSPGWLRDALGALGRPVDSVSAGSALSPEEVRFRPVALRILSTYEYQRPDYDACTGGQHPCPWVSCHHHLKLTRTEGGTLQDNHPGVDVDEMEFTCEHDVVESAPVKWPEEGCGVSAAKVGQLLGIKRGRVNQIARRFKAAMRERLS